MIMSLTRWSMIATPELQTILGFSNSSKSGILTPLQGLSSWSVELCIKLGWTASVSKRL